MKVLILGALGNLGGALTRVYAGHEIVAWDKNELDITDEVQLTEKMKQLRPDVVYNCAAYNAVDKAEQEPDIANLINGYAVGYIAKACTEVNVTMVHFSTNYVFDGTKGAAYIESDVPNPLSMYAKSKLLGEAQLSMFGEHAYLVRTSLLYGGENALGKKSFVDIMLNVAKEKTEVDVVDDEVGNPTYVVDLASAVKELVEKKYPFGTYHLVNSGQASWYDWAKEIFAIREISIKVNAVPATNFPRPAKRPNFAVLSNTKGPVLRSWQEALREYLRV